MAFALSSKCERERQKLFWSESYLKKRMNKAIAWIRRAVSSFLPKSWTRQSQNRLYQYTVTHTPLRCWDLSCSIFQDTRNPLKKEEMEKRYVWELTQTTIVSAVLVTSSLSTFLLNSLVGQSLRAPQNISFREFAGSSFVLLLTFIIIESLLLVYYRFGRSTCQWFDLSSRSRSS